MSIDGEKRAGLLVDERLRESGGFRPEPAGFDILGSYEKGKSEGMVCCGWVEEWAKGGWRCRR